MKIRASGLNTVVLTPKSTVKRPQRDQLKTMMHNLSHTLTLMWDIHEKRKKETRSGLGEAEEDEKNFLCRLSQWDPGKVVPRQNAK